jgi:hypothetical protein
MKHLILVALLLTLPACAGRSVKQNLDTADRAAFASLRAFQVSESAAYHAKLPWPTPDQHQQIGAKLSQAYTLVIDVAEAGIALQPGASLPAALQAEMIILTKTVLDIVALAHTAPQPVQDQAARAVSDTASLVNRVTGGK